MIGQIVENGLYVLFFLTVLVSVEGTYTLWHARRGAAVSMDGRLAALALIAASAPYIGLFGTVWHIIQALSGLGVGNLNVTAIAKPIGEALYATMWGLGSAIPALIVHKGWLVWMPTEDASNA